MSEVPLYFIGKVPCAFSSTIQGAGTLVLEGRCKAALQEECKLAWREAVPPNHLNDEDQKVVTKELSLSQVLG